MEITCARDADMAWVAPAPRTQTELPSSRWQKAEKQFLVAD